MRQSDSIAVLVVAVLLLAVPGCGPGVPGAPPPSAARPTPQPAASLPAVGATRLAPRTGGKVVVYSALSESVNAAIVDAFERAQPVIGVEMLTLAAAGDLEAHVRAEKAAPKADIVLGGSSEYHDALGRDGLLEPYAAPGAAGIDSALKDPKGCWTGWYLGVLGVMVNTDRWEAAMPARAMPVTWDDLLAPGLAGKTVVPDPVTTGAGYILLANQVFRFNGDEARAMDFMRRLNQGIGQYTSTALEAVERLASGEFVAGVNWGHDVLTAAGRGKPVRFIAPDATAFEVGAVSIVRGSPNPSGARAFVDWVLSREAADVVVRLSNRLSVLKRVEPSPGAPTLESVRLVNYDRAWATENKDRLLGNWRAAVGR